MLEIIKNVVLIYGTAILLLAVVLGVCMFFNRNDETEVDHYED